MTDKLRTVFVCSCEGTMPLDPRRIEAGCGGGVRTAHQLCRTELSRFRAALAEGLPITVGCLQETAVFEEAATEAGFAAPLAFAGLRESGGWSDEAAASGPKMAALLAAAAEPMPPVPLTALESEGVVLVLGTGEEAVEAGRRLADSLDVTVVLRPGAEVPPPRRSVFPVLQGRIRQARGHLGAFELIVDRFAHPAPASRSRLEFGDPTDGATSRADIVLDLTGEPPLFPAHEVRPGYLRADPRNSAAVAEATIAASGLIGTFDKPRFVAFDAGLCAHSRSGIAGCTRCLDLCPTGAITPAGDSVTIDPAICAGCGQCAGACPTGAASYALPPAEALIRRIRAALLAYGAAGGRAPVLLLHDDVHGAALIDASARHGLGLPARVLPLVVNEIGAIGPETLAAATAYGATAVRVLGRGRPRHDLSGLEAALDLGRGIFAAFGYGAQAVGLIETDDPDMLEAALRDIPTGPPRPDPARFLPTGGKRELMELAFREAHRVAPAPVDRIPLPEGAPFGAVLLDTDACTLCLACVAACPTGALTDNPERPMLRFTESLCVQCGLCARTCPENAIALVPQLDIPAWDRPKRVMKEEAPFPCTRCGKPFGTRSAIEKVQERLADHWMFTGDSGSGRLRLLELCEDCRVSAVVADGFDPHDPGERRVRTTDDYLRERDAPVRSARRPL